jgi:hypothetical protein
MKKNGYLNQRVNSWFWRTTQRQEIDYIEEKDGRFLTFGFKYKPHKNARIPKPFRDAYPDHSFEIITPENYAGFLR